jgi:hypothetical protein
VPAAFPSFGLQDFRQLDARLTALGRELGKAYRRQLWDELSAYTDRYYSAICMENACMLKVETDHEVFCRDRIAVLLHELEKDHDTGEIKNLILMLDRNLFCGGENGIGEISACSLKTPERISPRTGEEKTDGSNEKIFSGSTPKERLLHSPEL